MAFRTAKEIAEAATGSDGWSTVVEEAGIKVQFDKPGDVFVGIYLNMETITDPNPKEGEDGEFLAASFTGIFPAEVTGKPCQIFPGWKLRNALESAKVAAGDTVRITYVKDIDMSGNGRNPMKDFRVEVKRI